MTGWPPGLLQDDCKKLHEWFASRIDARWVVRSVCYEIQRSREMTDLKATSSLYDITGDIKDINTMLVTRQLLQAAEKDAARLNWLLSYFVSDDTSKDDEIIAASNVGVHQIKSVIDAAMKEQNCHECT